ncbi:polyphosphate kinase 1 [Xylocopilactobacillus apicola]|uniref:Polyphosphate kinase n=1 Tax=Xylocopilactobacillus apicola TaxID=2932184 RepID=A0AAU9DDX4_9LACO|nr:polyphosphate kinase 1 [Xylocopilactobacillus apicola]BDR59042.1 polyphosphate kinase [Xylocopilactobacillus apicola]
MEMSKQHDFMNREISWLAFNDRILDNAQSPAIPLLERTKFLKITQANLDEWYMIRVASLIREVQAGDFNPDKSGLAPNTQLNQVRKLVKRQLKRQNKIWLKIKGDLANHKINLLDYQKLSVEQRKFADNYFLTTVSPLIEVELLPKDIPWPEMENGAMYFVSEMISAQDPSKHIFSHFKLPPLNRLLVLPEQSNCFILLEQIIKAHFKELIQAKFKGRFIAQKIYLYRILKDMDIRSLPKESKNTEQAVEIALEKRASAPVIFLAVDSSMPRKTLKTLTEVLDVNPLNTFHINGDWDYNFIDQLCQSIVNAPANLHFQKRSPHHESDLEGTEIFAKIQNHDYLLHHPYDSYDGVVNFFAQAAIDPTVKEIYVTIYRTSHDSPIVKSLADAAKHGKKVNVLIEVKARFDEEHNIKVADYLRGIGINVYTSFPDLKIHCKMALVVRDDKSTIAHLATGNYNEATAKGYTDFSFFTARLKYAKDIKRIFQYINGKKKLPNKLNKLYIAPNMLRSKLEHEIKKTIKKAQDGENCEIWIKCNSLSDYKLIKNLYDASSKGVKVHLLIRGLTTAVPQLPGVSTNLHIHSIVGRLLEHSRVYIFISEKNYKCYLSSADVMPRNFDRRIETLFPIEDPDLKERILNIFERMWNDRVQSYTKHANGTYMKRINNKNATKIVPIQEQFLIEAEKKEN